MSFKQWKKWTQGIDRELLEKAKNEPLPVRIIRFTAAGVFAALIFASIVGIAFNFLAGLVV